MALQTFAVSYDFISLNNYTQPSSVQSVTTSAPDTENKIYSWKFENNELISGNAKIASSLSILKISVTGSGAVSFQYKLTGGTTKNSFLISKDPKFLDNVKSGYTDLDNNNVQYERLMGEIDWTWNTVTIEADENVVTELYLAYRTVGTTCKSNDTVEIRNLLFSSGKAAVTATSNDPTLGDVSGAGEYLPGEEITVTATPKTNSEFFGWIRDGELVSRNRSYSLSVTGDIQLTAVFGLTEKTVAQNLSTGAIFPSVTEAVSDAVSDETVLLLKDAEITENTVIPNGVTLYVPFENNDLTIGFADGTASASSCLASDIMVYRKLTVADGVTVTVDGTLRVGGVIGYPGQQYQGHTSGAFGKIENNGTVVVNNGAVLDIFGFVTGNGKVIAENGATIYEPFIVYDFSGGSNTLKLNNAGQSPFTQYTMQNIRCTLEFNEGAALMGRCNLYAFSEFNKTDAIIIGNASLGGIIQLSEGAILTRTVDLTKVCSGYCEDLGRVVFDITGGGSLNALTMKVLGVDVSTKNVLFPLTYGCRFDLRCGIYSIGTGIVMMPGAEMIIEEDAELNVNNRFFVLDGLRQGELSGKSYPTTELLQSSGFSSGGALIVNGTLRISDLVQFGGIIQSKKTGATVVTPQPSSQIDYFKNQITLGGEAAYGNNTAVTTIEARIYDGEKLIKLESGSTYTFRSISPWTLESYSMDKYVSGETEYGQTTVTVNRNMYGSLKEEKIFALGDINQDGAVNSKDATRLAKYLADLLILDDEQLLLADVNGDTAVNSKDATRLAKYLADLIPSLCS